MYTELRATVDRDTFNSTEIETGEEPVKPGSIVLVCLRERSGMKWRWEMRTQEIASRLRRRRGVRHDHARITWDLPCDRESVSRDCLLFCVFCRTEGNEKTVRPGTKSPGNITGVG